LSTASIGTDKAHRTILRISIPNRSLERNIFSGRDYRENQKNRQDQENALPTLQIGGHIRKKLAPAIPLPSYCGFRKFLDFSELLIQAAVYFLSDTIRTTPF
jgi:hypothetical protein